MNETQTELSFLKEFIRIIETPDQRVIKFKRISVTIGLISIGILFLTGFLLSNDILSIFEAMFLAYICGMSIGIGILYRISAMQIPYFNKYFDPKMDEIRSRINELQK